MLSSTFVVNKLYNAEETLSSKVLQVATHIIAPNAIATNTNSLNSPLLTARFNKTVAHSEVTPNITSNSNVASLERNKPIPNRYTAHNASENTTNTAKT